MYFEMLKTITTKEEAIKLADEIDVLLASYYKKGEGGFNQVLSSGVRAKTASLLKEMLFVKGSDYGKLLEGLKDELKGMESVKITVALDLSEKTMERIGVWVKENVGEGAVAEFFVNPSIIAGATIAYKGRYKDFSLEKEFKERYIKTHDKYVKGAAQVLS